MYEVRFYDHDGEPHVARFEYEIDLLRYCDGLRAESLEFWITRPT